MSKPRLCAAILAAGTMIGIMPTASLGNEAATYPQHLIRLIVPFAPGGSTDALARLLATGMSEKLRQSVVVENKPGAGGNIAMRQVAQASPDGYTLLLASSSIVVNPSLYNTLPYDPVKSFEPVSYLASAPSLLIAHPEVSANNVEELVKLFAEKKQPYNYASPGIGTAQHLAGELFNLEIPEAGLGHIPFNGAGPSVVGVMSNVVPLGFASLPAALGQVRSGDLKALAITSRMRSPAAPDIPTFLEQGYEHIESDHLQGLLAPANTPPEVVEKLAKISRDVLEEPSMQSRLADLGFIVVASTPEEFRQEIAQQLPKWQKVVERANLQKN